ncbi:trimethyllysine dioxygenase, mitochondrial [Phlebotomus argentipes]|uniref:trimethyllysine dioxygenase, mitochondrial n=1 Tax=Phlebotomus argentipes TaxID=94469 RepID=UPI00289375D2|nr:trimethyllysine dioxygenase, mitochondrial [Phlebotomus argentipes]
MQHYEKKKRACVVPVCKDERFDLVHKLPMNAERAEEWILRLDIPDLLKHSVDELRKRIFVCCRHFRKQDYKNVESRCLNKTAVPSINLKLLDNFNVIDPSVMVQSKPEVEEVQQTMQSLVQRVLPPVQKARARQESSSPVKVLNMDRKRTKADELEKILEASYSVESPPPKAAKGDKQNHYFILPCAEEQPRAKVTRKVDDRVTEVLKMYVNLPEVEVVEAQPDPNESPSLIMSSECLSVPSRNLKLNYFWLRDHCRCLECYNHETKQRRFSVLTLAPDVRAKSCQFSDESLDVSWSDGHESQYTWDFIEEHSYELKSRESGRILWDAATIAKSDYARVSLGDFMSDDDVARSVVESLVCFGVAFVDKVPPNISCTELAIKRLFPVHKTFFGEMWSFQSGVMKESDTAYTHEALGAHTDNTYFCDPAGLQVLHCTEFEGDGGESLLVDGFKVARDVKRKHPEVYERLCSTEIPFEYIDETYHHAYTAPVIKKDKINDAVEQIRFNLYDRAPMNTLPYEKIQQFYDDIRTMALEVASKRNEWWFKLTPGTVMIFDNWRLLHGRASLTGKRSMCGCYISRTDFMSVARTMKLVE